MTNQKNLILFGLVAIAALWLMQQGRRGVAATAAPAAGRVPGMATQADRNATMNALFGGLGAWLSGSGTVRAGGAAPGGATRIINDDLPGQAGYGWSYFSDGTAISPAGEYYWQGEKVWSPDAVAINPPASVFAAGDSIYQG